MKSSILRNPSRRESYLKAASELEVLNLEDVPGRNGEELATDEAALWKRVLSYRVAKHIGARRVLETHPGLGVGSQVYAKANEACSLDSVPQDGSQYCIVDIDPFGHAWKTIGSCLEFVRGAEVVQVTSGEVQGVVRNLASTLSSPTNNVGKKAPIWVREEYIPKLQNIVGKPVRFFYAFPTSVRVVLSCADLPDSLWQDCPKWMWWFEKYA